ncbi:MAG: family 16 glycoside hydrolase [Acidimicrobiia bacterium]
MATGRILIGVGAEYRSEAQQAHNMLTAAERAEGWQLLFDGQTTHGWRGFRRPDMPAGWLVVDGELQVVGHGGDIITMEQFADFELALESSPTRQTVTVAPKSR